jgi:hypothetical protein
MYDFGQIKKVDIKSIWKNEALNFTPWLADNLDKLSDLIGLDLELTSREAEVGDFSLDLLAKDLSTNRNVVIENQFNPTDHKHLGQLITYASYYKANVIIWISEEVREEHRAAIDWLNSNTNDDIEFFAVEIEVIQIDNSKPALNFKLKANPNEWSKANKKVEQTGNSETQSSYMTFFQNLIDELRVKHKFTNARAGQPQSWYAFSTGVRGFVYGTSFARGERVRVDLYIDTGKGERNKEIFRQLREDEEQIHKEFGDKLEWEELPDKRATRIATYRQGSIDEDSKTLTEIKDWAIENLLRLKKVFEGRIKKYKD